MKNPGVKSVMEQKVHAKVKSDDVMCDLETLGKRAGCQILSIGACFFTRQGDQVIGNTFYTVCSTRGKAQEKIGLAPVDASTADWWERQGDEARKVLTESRSASAPKLSDALREFDAFLALGAAGGLDKVRIWGNGSDFDNSILYAAYEACKVPLPWNFWNSRCFRTLKSEALNVIVPERKGTHHNALDDAIFQAEHAAAIFRTQQGNFVRRGI